MAASFLLLIHAGLSSGCFAERMVGEPLVLPEGLPVTPKKPTALMGSLPKFNIRTFWGPIAATCPAFNLGDKSEESL